MIYSVSSLQTVADCNTMLSMANNDKSALLLKQADLQLTKTRYQQTAVDVEAELPLVQAEVASKTASVASAPEGSVKELYKHQLRKAESKLYVLTTKKAAYGSIAVLDKEWELARVEHDLTEVDALIAAIEARKVELEQQG